MTLTMKVAPFLAILVMDAIGGLLVIRKLKTEGKSSGIPVILVAMVMSLLVIGVVLFTVV